LADLPTTLASGTLNPSKIKKEFPNVNVIPVETDVSQFSAVKSLKKKVDSEFKGKEVGALMSNAGTSAPSVPFAREGLDQGALRANYDKFWDTNLWGVINAVQAFLPELVKQTSPGVVICTGLKQVPLFSARNRTNRHKGITNPPGTPAYNISKTGVRFFTESLACDLQTNYPKSPTPVHLLILGWVYTVFLQPASASNL